MKTNCKVAKFNKLFSLLLSIVIAVALLPMVMISAFAVDDEKPSEQWTDYAAKSFDGGTGTESDPYLIATEEQLAKLSADVAGALGVTANTYFGKWFKLTSDLDLSAHRWNPIGQHRWAISVDNPDDENGDTIANHFEGNFDGNGKTIRGIYVDEKEDGFAGGLFGCVAINSSGEHNDIVIRDLTIKDAKLYGNGNGLKNGYNGILAATFMGSDLKGRITVKNVHVSGLIDITDADKVDVHDGESWGCYMAGGMGADINYVDFIDCSVDYLDLKGKCTNSGGFVAISTTSTYTDCSARGTIEGQWAMGGFVGYAAAAGTYNKFTRCVANVDVTATDWNVGGFCGYSCCSAEFTECAAFGDIESKVTTFSPRVSGFIGYIQNLNEYNNYLSMNSVLNNCYFGGTIKSAHSEISPSIIATVDDELVVKGCAYNSDKISSNINLFSDVYEETELASYTATALSGDAFYNTVCNTLYGHHQYEGNTCKICELKMVYVNEDGYWVVDGCATDIKAVGEDGINGINGKSGIDGKNSLNGLSITAMVIGSVALASNIALVAYALIKKKIFF